MSSRRSATLLLLALAVVGAGVYWHFRTATTPVAAAQEPAADASRIKADGVAALAVEMPATPSAPLPPKDARLPDIASTLQSRADAGDRKAACRLGIELLRCQLLQRHPTGLSGHMDAQEASADGKGELAEADHIATLNLHYHELADACSALPASLIAQGPQYLRQAALAGEPEAMLRYADGQAFNFSGSGYAFLRSPEFDQWRAEAPTLLQRALASGRTEAVYLLQQAYAGDDGWIQGLYADDPLRAHAYFLLQRRLFGSSTVLPEALAPADLDATQRQEAEQLADRWHRDQFDGGTFDFRSSMNGVSPLYDVGAVTPPNMRDHAFCEPVGSAP